MKNLALIIAASLVLFTSFSQDQIAEVFKPYTHIKTGVDVNKNEMVYYTSPVDQKQTADLWSDYTPDGIDLIINEANRILLIFDVDEDSLLTREDFLVNGMFDASEGDGTIYRFTFSDGSYMKVGAFDADEYVPDWGHVKYMKVLFKQMENIKREIEEVVKESIETENLEKIKCNFKKIPGKNYYLYQKPNNELFFSMLSPKEWNSNNNFIDEYFYDYDHTLQKV